VGGSGREARKKRTIFVKGRRQGVGRKQRSNNQKTKGYKTTRKETIQKKEGKMAI